MGKATKVAYEGKMVDAEQLEFAAEQEPWAAYKLDDGTVAKFKHVLAKAYKLTNQFLPNGDPVYIFQAGAVASLEVPENLRKRTEEGLIK